MLGSAQIAVEADDLRMVASGDYKNVPDPTCAPFELVACDVFITERPLRCRCSVTAMPTSEIAKLLHSVALFPERAHLVGAYSLGKAQRVIALLRQAGYRAPIYLHGAMESITAIMLSQGIALGELRPVRGADKAELAGTITLCPPSALSDVWTRRFPDPLTAFASGWMRVRARARQYGVALPLVISDHADWDGLTATIAATGAGEIWVTHGQEDALVHWCATQGLKARPLDIVGYGDEDDEIPPHRGRGGQRRGGAMNRFAELLDRLTYEPARNAKLRLMTDYFRSTPDPERGWALAALTGALSFPHAKAGLLPQPDRRAHRSGAVRALLRLCRRSFRNHRADVAQPTSSAERGGEGSPSLRPSSNALPTSASRIAGQLARWLDALDETGRWALIKLVTGGAADRRFGAAREAALAALGGTTRRTIEGSGTGWSRPICDLFAWLEGRGEKPRARDPAPFRPAMLAHALDEPTSSPRSMPADFVAEWKWDGIRVQAVAACEAGRSRGFIRAPAKIFPRAFPI